MARNKPGKRSGNANTAHLVPVRFTRHWRGYNVDEVAGFRPEVAEKLVGAKVGKMVSAQEIAAHKKKRAEAAAKVKEAEAAVTKPAKTVTK